MPHTHYNVRRCICEHEILLNVKPMEKVSPFLVRLTYLNVRDER